MFDDRRRCNVAVRLFREFHPFGIVGTPDPKPVSVNAGNIITPFNTGEYDIVQKLNVVLNGDSIFLKLVIMGIVLLLIFSVLPTVLAMRYHPRQIFQKTE